METISKHIAEGFAKGELYAALAYDATDRFGGMAIKAIRFNPASASSVALSIYGTMAKAIDIGDSDPLTTATSGQVTVKCRSYYSALTGSHTGCQYVSKLTGDGANSSFITAIKAWAELEGAQTNIGTTQGVYAMEAYTRISGTAYNTSLTACSMKATIDGTGTLTAFGHACVLWLDNKLPTIAAGEHSIIYMTNNNSGSRTIGQAIYLYGVYVTNLINLNGCTSGGMVSNASASALHGTLSKKIKISIDGVTYYLLASTTPT